MHAAVGVGNKINLHHGNMQNTNTPDIDLERDLLDSEAEVLLGIEASELTSEKGADKRFQVNIATIVISALIFLAILAWFDFIQTTFYSWLVPQIEDPIPSSVKLWYAIGVTIFIFFIIVLIYYYSRYNIK